MGSADGLAPGGRQIMVVLHYLVDSKDSTAREYLARHMCLLGVVCLPDTTFQENTNTDAVRDTARGGSFGARGARQYASKSSANDKGVITATSFTDVPRAGCRPDGNRCRFAPLPGKRLARPAGPRRAVRQTVPPGGDYKTRRGASAWPK